ncbi:MAG: DUF86 domain-containing protein, partial [Pseudomonadota bacterium]|nr:DUF86 domain-containing protein [Pseudomonadota bacterium]
MSDEILVSKMAMIAHCAGRAREEYGKDPITFLGDITRRDAATLNVLRAWEAAVEMGDEVIGSHALGTPEEEAEVFTLLAEHGWIDAALADELKHTGEFCRAEWDYQAAPLPALIHVVKRGLDSLQAYAAALVARDAQTSG